MYSASVQLYLDLSIRWKTSCTSHSVLCVSDVGVICFTLDACNQVPALAPSTSDPKVTTSASLTEEQSKRKRTLTYIEICCTVWFLPDDMPDDHDNDDS